MTGTGYSSDLTDLEWALLEPLLPGPRRTGRKRIHSPRVLVNAMLYVLMACQQWFVSKHAPLVAVLVREDASAIGGQAQHLKLCEKWRPERSGA